MTKYRSGFFRIKFDDEIVDRPISADTRAISTAYWGEGDEKQWMKPEVNDRSELEWRRSQEVLAVIAQVEGRYKGGNTRAAQRELDTYRINYWLYTLLSAAWSAWEADSSPGKRKRMGWKALIDEVCKHDTVQNDPRRQYVTEHRVRNWLKGGRLEEPEQPKTVDREIVVPKSRRKLPRQKAAPKVSD